MKGVFSYDGPFSQFVGKLIDLVLLSFLWLIFSIPIITIGASSTALYYACRKVLTLDEGGVWVCFWGSFKQNFWQSSIVWFFLAIFYMLFGLNAYFGYVFYELDELPLGLLVVIGVVAFLVIGWTCWIFPYISQFTNTIRVVLSNCLYMFMRHFGISVLLVVIFVASAILTVIFPFGLAVAPGVCAWSSSFALESVFKKYAPEDYRTRESVHEEMEAEAE